MGDMKIATSIQVSYAPIFAPPPPTPPQQKKKNIWRSPSKYERQNSTQSQCHGGRWDGFLDFPDF